MVPSLGRNDSSSILRPHHPQPLPAKLLGSLGGPGSRSLHGRAEELFYLGSLQGPPRPSHTSPELLE